MKALTLTAAFFAALCMTASANTFCMEKDYEVQADFIYGKGDVQADPAVSAECLTLWTAKVDKTGVICSTTDTIHGRGE